MRHLVILIVLCILPYAPALGQAKGDTIQINKKGHNYYYKKDGRVLTSRKLLKVIRTDPGAFKLVHKARAKGLIGAIIAGAGGGLIGYELGNAITGAKIQPVAIAIGAGFIGLSIPINISADHLERKAVVKYNTDMNKASYRYRKPEYYITFTGNGMGLIMRF